MTNDEKDEAQVELSKLLQRMSSDIASQFTEEDLETPRVCALACALTMQLFLSMAKITQAERDDFFHEIIPDMEEGWHFSPDPVKASPEDNLLVVQVKPSDAQSDQPDWFDRRYFKRMETPSKLVN